VKKIVSIREENLTVSISVPLILEYESIFVKHQQMIGLSKSDISDFLDYLCMVGRKTKIFYLWRPMVKDPHDDHVLEVAVASGSRHIITFNKKDFIPAKAFEISTVTPKEFLMRREKNEYP
jgi:predicted nucleic acid-binding protein